MTTDTDLPPAGAAGPFRGWPADATAFLAEIAADNTAEFWAAHRQRHAASVLPPLRALTGELRGEFGELRVFRPYRDRRFRPDAPPYRTDAGAVCSSPGGTARAVLLTGTELVVEVGLYAFDRPKLRAYRAALGVGPAGGACAGGAGATGTARPPAGPAEATASGEQLAALLAGLVERGFVVDGTRRLTGTPRGVATSHPHLELLRHRGLLVRRAWPAGEWLATPEPVRRVRVAWRAAEPLVDWLDEHLGPALGVPDGVGTSPASSRSLETARSVTRPENRPAVGAGGGMSSPGRST
jgi:uncharacterized protein (DUF2461 family)